MSVSVFTIPLLLLGTALLLLIDYLLAREFYKAAFMKGWADRKYFWLAFFFGIAGYLLVAALPDRGGAGMSALVSDELPEL